MKTASVLVRILAITLSLFSSYSCTNNGHIGYLYGLWLMESFTINGQNADINIEDYTWRFQSNLILLTDNSLPGDKYTESIGTWQFVNDEKYLELNFTHVSEDTSLNSPVHNPPAALCIPPRAITLMTIDSHSSNRLTLSFTNSQGDFIQYRLKKSY